MPEKASPSNKIKLVLSDLHLGTGIPCGRPNPMEEFTADEELADFLEYYSKGSYGETEVELFLNGDIFDFLKVPYEGRFPEECTESIAVDKLKRCLAGHPKVTEALRLFLSRPNKRIVYIPGNHDIEMMFPAVQQVMREKLKVQHEPSKLSFVCEPYYYNREEGIQIHHGHQFEPIHRFDYSRIMVHDPELGESVIYPPWGSLYVIKIITRFKEQRPYITQVRPFSMLIFWGLVFDLFFALKLLTLSLYYFVRFRLFKARHYRSKIWSNLQLMRKELAPNPRLERYAQGILRGSRHTKLVVFGHTHGAMVRTLEGGVYINTGTWVPCVSLDIATLGQDTRFTYCLIDYPDGEAQGHLMEWQGWRNPCRELRI